MAQKRAWEYEYNNQKFVSTENKPHAEVVRLIRNLRKSYGFTLEGSSVLDIGCGTGRNAYYCAQEGGTVIGIDISENALKIARGRVRETNLSISYVVGDISEILPAETQSIDLVIDILASNSLSNHERKTYTEELSRVIKPGGFFFLRTLAREGDKNAAELLKRSPGLEKNTYVIKDLNLTETVFTKEELLSVYGSSLELVSLQKKAHYPHIDGRVYKRQFYYALFRKTV